MSKYFTLHLLEIEQLQGKIETEKKGVCSTMSSNSLWRRISYFIFTFQYFGGQLTQGILKNRFYCFFLDLDFNFHRRNVIHTLEMMDPFGL